MEKLPVYLNRDTIHSLSIEAYEKNISLDEYIESILKNRHSTKNIQLDHGLVAYLKKKASKKGVSMDKYIEQQLKTKWFIDKEKEIKTRKQKTEYKRRYRKNKRLEALKKKYNG